MKKRRCLVSCVGAGLATTCLALETALGSWTQLESISDMYVMMLRWVGGMDTVPSVCTPRVFTHSLVFLSKCVAAYLRAQTGSSTHTSLTGLRLTSLPLQGALYAHQALNMTHALDFSCLPWSLVPASWCNSDLFWQPP